MARLFYTRGQRIPPWQVKDSSTAKWQPVSFLLDEKLQYNKKCENQTEEEHENHSAGLKKMSVVPSTVLVSLAGCRCQ